MIVSIDIGTSYSSICRLGPDGKVQPVDISTGASMFGSKYSLPSAVFVEDGGNILVGQAALNNRRRRPENCRMEFKRNLGEDAPVLLGERSFHTEDLYTELFRHMKVKAEKGTGSRLAGRFSLIWHPTGKTAGKGSALRRGRRGCLTCSWWTSRQRRRCAAMRRDMLKTGRRCWSTIITFRRFE